MEGTYLDSNLSQSNRYQYFKKTTDIPAGGRNRLLGVEQLDSLGSLGSQRAVANYSDQIPPITITLTSMNEYGNISAMHLLGVELINEGSGVSIDDIVTETQMTFVARAIIGWRPISQEGGNVNVDNVVSQLNRLTAVQQASLLQAAEAQA